MTKRLLTFIFFLCLTRTFACSCSPPSIESSYKSSTVIFVGQYMGPDHIGGMWGWPIDLENFEVFKFVKGKDIKLIKQALKKYNLGKPVVTLLSSKHSSCGYTFAKGKYYLIYAYKSYDYGLLTTHGCTSTHEIAQDKLNDFLADSSGVPELAALNKLVKAYPPDPHDTEPDSPEYVPKVFLLDCQENLQKEIRKRNIILWITLPAILILLATLLFRGKK